MTRPRPPWWMFLVLVPCAAYVLLTWYLHLFGPETPGLVFVPPSWQVVAIQPGLAADRAGIRVGDTIVTVNGLQAWAGGAEFSRVRLGKRYDVVLERDGRRQEVSWTTGRNTMAFWRDPEGVAALALVPEALLSTLLAWFIALRRPDHATARLGAILFALSPVSSIAWFNAPAGWSTAVLSLPVLLAVVPVFAVVLADSLGPLLVMFYANFPRPAVRGRWIWALVSLPAVFQLVASLARLHWVLWPGSPRMGFYRWLLVPARIVGIGYAFAAAAALLWNYHTQRDASDRRRIRLFVAGFFVALLPVLVEAGLRIAAVYGGQGAQSLLLAYWLSPWTVVGTLIILSGELMQAFAILRHRLLDVSVMVRQGLQYAAARGVLLALAPAFGLMLIGDLVLHADQTMAQAFVQRGWLYAALGVAALVAHARRDRWMSALDRRFFRERYDAQRILRDVLTEVRNASAFGQAAPRAIAQIDAALHTLGAAVLVRRPQDAAFRAAGFAGNAPPEIPADSRLMSLVRVLGKPVEIEQSESGWLRRQLPANETNWLTRSRIEWVFPIALGEDRNEALLVLGPKRSEEPYTQEDRDLVEGIASGLALLHERLTAPLSSGIKRSGSGAFLVPPVTERYVIRRELGRGGMGTVYEATDTELDRGVAIKIMRPDLMTSAEARARFKREARAAAAFSHPNVVTIYDVGVADDGRAYLVMELLHGATLREVLRQDGRMPAARAVAIMRGVCAAIEEAHGRRLLHRDLKPENVFLASTATGEAPKVLDFGVAKLLEAPEETALAADTSPGQLLGTLAYMSPEQLRGLPPDPGWDLWALGVMAYEMLTGSHPFGGRLQRLADLDARSVAPTTSHLGPHARQWDEFFARALAPDPGTRPATPRAWLAAFEETVAKTAP